MIPPRSLSSFLFLQLAVLAAMAAMAAMIPSGVRAATLDQIPSPRPMGWVTDLTGTLPLQTVAELNRLGDQVKAQTGSEMAVVVVGSTDGAPAHDLAARLLTSWAIGERRKVGLLLFVAVNDGTSEIALGEGISDATRLWESQAVMRMAMAPRFRNGDPAGAVLQGAAACARRLLGAQVTVAMPAADDPLPSTAVPDPQTAPEAGAPAANPRGGLGLLLGIGLVCAGLLAAWGIALKLLHFAPRPRQRRRKVKLARLDPAVGDATGSW
jgi:uncharacterized membrane protein YgcG